MAFFLVSLRHQISFYISFSNLKTMKKKMQSKICIQIHFLCDYIVPTECFSVLATVKSKEIEVKALKNALNFCILFHIQINFIILFSLPFPFLIIETL